MPIKENDFIEIDYTGKLTEDNLVFDTTLESVAKKENLDTKNNKYKPAVVCIGENQLIKGVEENLIGKEVGTSFTIEVEPEKGFGKKSAKLLRMIPLRVFKKQNIDPQPGLQVQIDGQMGTVRTANSGRIIVDFNNPLSGRNLTYEVKINKIVEDTIEKTKALIEPVFGEVEVSFENDIATIQVPFEMPKEILDPFKEKILKLIKEIKQINFKVKDDKKITPQK